ncbi:hypothetical protein P280DRAFT_411968 [Massarina eburnea CBS 473.64]|uniref:SprT-like domain-containing protein n=1 Tax=Massarina eburnea CBS 473.64 TaxID=1395130 RepID=A0A6A6RJR8_9PLEO|nr:hypothetical protein P280DRAFT_411968 [Massarina eburnea CBS 473.64]
MTSGSTNLTRYPDRPWIGNRYSLYHPYQHDSEPDSYYRQPPSRGPRPLSTIALNKLQDPRLKCERNLGWSIDWAVAFIVDHLNSKNSPDAATALKHIRIRAANLEREGYIGEIPYHIFNKLDETLFAGHLKNAVYLDIRSLGPDVSGHTHSQGWGPDAKVKRVSIILNGDVLQEARSKDIVAALIHHMIHAYFLVACGPQQEKEVAYGRLGHGHHFGKIMMAIKELSAANKRPLTALDFGHSLGQSRDFYGEYHHQQRKPYRQRRAKEVWYRSQCTSDVDGLSDGEIEEWYGGVCKPLLDLPESLRTLNVTIYNDHKSVLIPASRVNPYFSIARAIEKAGSRYLEIHEDVSTETFECFLELLHTDSYSPDPKHIMRTGNKGPPVIKGTQAESEPYILTDIKMFKMGGVMGFGELKDMALERMYRHVITHEDPVALLREIYDGGEPDADLKTWTRKFLMRVPCANDAVGGDWMGLSVNVGGRGPVVEPSNLAKLECEMLAYRPAFFELLESSSALKYEVSKAKRDLVSNNLYAPPSLYPNANVAIAQVARPLSPAMNAYGIPVARPLGLGMPMRPQMIGWISPEEAVERERMDRLAERRVVAQAHAQAQAAAHAAAVQAAANAAGVGVMGDGFYDGVDDGGFYWDE